MINGLISGLFIIGFCCWHSQFGFFDFKTSDCRIYSGKPTTHRTKVAVVDVISEEHKTRNIGLILLSISLGFIIGAIIGKVLSDEPFYPMVWIFHASLFCSFGFFAQCIFIRVAV